MKIQLERPTLGVLFAVLISSPFLFVTSDPCDLPPGEQGLTQKKSSTKNKNSTWFSWDGLRKSFTGGLRSLSGSKSNPLNSSRYDSMGSVSSMGSWRSYVWDSVDSAAKGVKGDGVKGIVEKGYKRLSSGLGRLRFTKQGQKEKRTLSRENTPPSQPSCITSPELSRVGLPNDVPTAATSFSPKGSASPSKTHQRSPPRRQPSSKSQSQIPQTSTPTLSPILSTVELSKPLPITPSSLPPSRAPPSSPQSSPKISPKNSARSSPKNSPNPSPPPLPKRSPKRSHSPSPNPLPKPTPRSSPSPPPKGPTSSPQGTFRASSVGDRLSGSPSSMRKFSPLPQPKPKWRFPLAAMPVSPPASPPPAVRPKLNTTNPRKSFRLAKWRDDTLIDPEKYMAPMTSADPNQILYRKLQNELLQYFTRDDNPPQRDIFRMDLVKIWEAECKLIPMYEAEIGKTFIEKFCLKEIDPEDHVPLSQGVPLKQGCMRQCAKSWGYIFIPGGNGSGDATDFFACGSLIPITTGEVSKDPEHAPKINPISGDITHVCNCALAPELYRLFDIYKISYTEFMRAKDESQERALEFLRTEFWPKNIMLMTHQEFHEWVAELFRKYKIPNPAEDYTLYEKKTKALGGEADEKAEDDYWKQQQFYRTRID